MSTYKPSIQRVGLAKIPFEIIKQKNDFHIIILGRILETFTDLKDAIKRFEELEIKNYDKA